jgi:hypothetical protein
LIDFRLGLPRIAHRAGRLEEPNLIGYCDPMGECRESGNEWCGVQCSVRKNRLAFRKRRRAHPMGMRYLGRWHFPISSKPFSGEVAVYERAAPSGSRSKLEVRLSPRFSWVRTERSTCANGIQNRWSSNGLDTFTGANVRPVAQDETKTVEVSNVVHHRVKEHSCCPSRQH